MLRRLGAGGLGLAFSLAACAGAPHVVSPPPVIMPPPSAPAEVAPPAVAPPEPSAAPVVEAPPAPVVEAAPKAPPVTLEIPFQLDKRPTFTTKEAFLLDLRERTRWNKGSLGTLAAEPPPVPGHP